MQSDFILPTLSSGTKAFHALIKMQIKELGVWFVVISRCQPRACLDCFGKIASTYKCNFNILT